MPTELFRLNGKDVQMQSEEQTIGVRHDKPNCRLLPGTSVSPGLAVRVKLFQTFSRRCSWR